MPRKGQAAGIAEGERREATKCDDPTVEISLFRLGTLSSVRHRLILLRGPVGADGTFTPCDWSVPKRVIRTPRV